MNTFLITMAVLYALSACVQLLCLAMGLYPMTTTRSEAFGVIALVVALGMFTWAMCLLITGVA